MRNSALSQFKFQSSAALNCRADTLGETTPNAEQRDPNSNGLCSWTSNGSDGKQKKQNCGYKNGCNVNVASTAMLLCLLKRRVLLCDPSGKCQTKSLPMLHLEEQNWKEKGHKILLKGKRIWILTVS